VTDRKPPRVVAGERETLLALLQYQRESVVRKVTGVDETAARTPLVDSGTTLLWLTKHLAHAETLWVLRRFAGEDTPLPDMTNPDSETINDAIALYRDTWARTDPILATAPLDAMCADTGSESPVSLRWVLMHLLEETARHAGHADILRELVDGSTGR
jgi:Protein of unknown function (DUF664)